jgi:DNA ligase-1
MPRMSPMLASTAKEPFDGEDWLFELKWDGYRCLAYLGAGEVYLDSRNGKPLLPQFPVLSSMAAAPRTKEVLLDGEIVAVKSGRVDFSYLRTSPSSVLYVAFDILWLDGSPTVKMPLHARKEALSGCMSWGGSAILSQTFETEGKMLFAWAKERDMEGVMAKRRDSIYLPGQRTTDWLKFKNSREGTFWVVGYVPSPGRIMGSVVAAERVEDRFRIVGRVSSGLNREYEEFLLERLRPLDRPGPAPAVTSLPSRAEMRQIHWVEPFMGVQVDFTEMTPDGHLRHPVLREVVKANAR